MELSVLIPWRSAEPERDVIFNWVCARYASLLPRVEVVVSDSQDEQFNRGQARNMAFEKSSGDILLIADADTIFEEKQIVAGVKRVLDGAPWVLPYGWYYNLNESVTSDLLNKDPSIEFDHEIFDGDLEWYDHKVVSWAGLIIMRREAYKAIRGYDECFNGWGYEDNAFRLCADTLLGPHERLPEFSCYHLWHPVAEGFNNPHIQENRRRHQMYVDRDGNVEAMKKLLEDR